MDSRLQKRNQTGVKPQSDLRQEAARCNPEERLLLKAPLVQFLGYFSTLTGQPALDIVRD